MKKGRFKQFFNNLKIHMKNEKYYDYVPKEKAKKSGLNRNDLYNFKIFLFLIIIMNILFFAVVLIIKFLY